MGCFCTSARTHHCKIVLLDDQELVHEVQGSSLGQEVFDVVVRHLSLLETAYFGLRYLDSQNQTHWLDLSKKMNKQMKGNENFTFYFGVKFYAADPCKLVEEITRYQFFLQLKQDILQGRVPVTQELMAELGAYVVQSELGDFDPRRHTHGYVSEFRFVSNQNAELENRIGEIHKELTGQVPAVAELNFLDKVKWLDMYGVDLHPVLGEDNVEYYLGLTPTGVIVLRNKNIVANYYWPRITKIFSKGKYFMLRVCDKNNDENTYGFETPSRPACKHLYKCSMEHHSFFRLVQVSPNPPDVISTRFSSGRADKSSVRSSQMSNRTPPSFTRTPSRRYQRRIVEGASDNQNFGDEYKTREELMLLSSSSSLKPQDKLKNCSNPQLPVHTMYVPNRSDSPRSTRSAPWGVWSSAPTRGLYSSSSPRSVRSGPHQIMRHARRSSSVDSQSSNDSRSCRKHRHRNNRRSSDNESEQSGRSGKSGKSHRKHRHRSRKSSTGDDHEHRRHRYQLVESEGQWREVQRRQAEGRSAIQKASVVRPRSGYANSGLESESEISHHSSSYRRRKHRKHRSRSRSPSESNSKTRLPEELKKHLEFELVETDGMTEEQLREIPYTAVKTSLQKTSNSSPPLSSKRKTYSSRRAKSRTQQPNQSGPTTRTSADPNCRATCSALYANPSTLHVGSANSYHHTSHDQRNPMNHSRWLHDLEQKDNAHNRRTENLMRDFPYSSARSSANGISADRPSMNAAKSTPPPWSSQEIRGTLGGGGVPWQCVPDRVYPVSGYGLPKNINQAAYQNRSNNNPETCVSSAAVDTNRNSAMIAMTTTTTDDAKSTASTTSTAVGQSIKSSKSFESGVLGQHANTPNGVIPWPGDRGKPRPSHQWDNHNGTSSPHHHLHHQQQQQQHHQQQQQQQQQHNGSSPYGGGGGGGEIFYLGNRSSGVRTSSRGGPTYFSPQHNHVDRLSNTELRSSASLEEILSPILQSKLTT
ncbi:PREDICTED: band 4.1-like protein 4 isoform X2 [Diuraphis noxia]|uniref:band 4.1-like protein 4 isoform X2 n=1 Tax=Diuraphis noxia TaxID=143948 RepID=UPI000763765E|nr:PREDICTED: band 4.1-like protein 4 isoform X2 [Diuraphis noxia]